jgi:hypothetical protein
MNKKQPRKLSWQYHDLAQKIQTGPRQHSAKLLLVFLGSVANDKGKPWPGYKAIMRNKSIRKKDTPAAALAVWKTAGILSWESGQGGGRDGTNKYRLNLDAMRALVNEQGLFDVETGKSRSDEITKIGQKLYPMRGACYEVKIGGKTSKSKYFSLPPLPSVTPARCKKSA